MSKTYKNYVDLQLLTKEYKVVAKNSQPTWATPLFMGFIVSCLKILLIVEAAVLTIKKGER